jgi:hypothetical protein
MDVLHCEGRGKKWGKVEKKAKTRENKAKERVGGGEAGGVEDGPETTV